MITFSNHAASRFRERLSHLGYPAKVIPELKPWPTEKMHEIAEGYIAANAKPLRDFPGVKYFFYEDGIFALKQIENKKYIVKSCWQHNYIPLLKYEDAPAKVKLKLPNQQDEESLNDGWKRHDSYMKGMNSVDFDFAVLLDELKGTQLRKKLRVFFKDERVHGEPITYEYYVKRMERFSS